MPSPVLSNLVGTHLILMMGNPPEPVPLALSEPLRRVEVTQSDDYRVGFQLTFAVGRGLGDVRDYGLLQNYGLLSSNRLDPFTRVLLIVSINAKPEPLLDGVITNLQLTPSEEPGNSNLVVTGKDLTQMMDLEEKQQPHEDTNWSTIVTNILSAYVRDYRITSHVQQLSSSNQPNNQTSTDLAYIRYLGKEVDFVFYIKPGLYPNSPSIAYWGEPISQSSLVDRQNALSVNMGNFSNVESINFQYDALRPEVVQLNESGMGEEQGTNSTTYYWPNFQPTLALQMAHEERTVIENLSTPQAHHLVERVRSRAQERCNRSFREAVTARGELDTAQYGGLLTAGKLVDLRGAGFTFDGTYYVKEVTHRINVQTGEFKQSFTLNREGFGALNPTVNL